MQRKLTLAKDAYLWAEGDHARNIAIVEKGKLAIRSGDEMLGVVLPTMVAGEGAISGLNGNGHRRAAAAIALEDDTVIVEYEPMRIKEAFDNAQPTVGRQILVTLMGQTFRNLLLLLSDEKVHPLTVAPVKGLVNGLVQSVTQLEQVADWKSFLVAFEVLTSFRNASEQLRRALVGKVEEAALVKATAAMKEHFAGANILPALEAFFQAEKERAAWLER